MSSAPRACAMQAEGRGDRRRVGLQRHWRALAQPRRRVRLHRRAHLHPQLSAWRQRLLALCSVAQV